MEQLVVCTRCNAVIPAGQMRCPKCPVRTHDSLPPGLFGRGAGAHPRTRQELEERALDELQFALGRAHLLGEAGVARARELYELRLAEARRVGDVPRPRIK